MCTVREKKGNIPYIYFNNQIIPVTKGYNNPTENDVFLKLNYKNKLKRSTLVRVRT